LIEVTHLTKRYGDHTAVSDLSFTIEKGQIYGFLGPNGAGKSTTMNIMTGCLAATGGQVTIDGHDIFEEAQQAKRLIGYLPEQPPLYLDRTPWEYLSFVAEAKGVAKNQRKEEVQRVMDVTQLNDVANRLIKNLSKGYKQRVGIAQALLGDPEIIILDEPTVGLDPRQIIEIRDLIQNLGKNHTVILSSHILSEVQAVCQTILIISKGKLVACDTPENLEKLFAGTATVELTAEATEEEVYAILAELPYITELTVTADGENRCHVRFDTDTAMDDSVCRDTFFAFAKAQRAILQMSMAKASLEDIFIELTSGDGAASAGIEAAEQSEEVEESEADEA
jgi:ABC-2 type transport system ATP-binding protein